MAVPFTSLPSGFTISPGFVSLKVNVPTIKAKVISRLKVLLPSPALKFSDPCVSRHAKLCMVSAQNQVMQLLPSLQRILEPWFPEWPPACWPPKVVSCIHKAVCQIAQSSRSWFVGFDSVSLPSPEEPYPPREWFEDPEWIHEICNCLSFKELFRFRFRTSGHINVNETRTYKTWIKSLAKSDPDSRMVALLDSRVTIGASEKGRSSSYALSRVLQGTIPYVVGSGLYPGCLHCYSADNKADEPSRDKPVRPRSFPFPAWLVRLQAGDPWVFDQVVQRSSHASCQMAAFFCYFWGWHWTKPWSKV